MGGASIKEALFLVSPVGGWGGVFLDRESARSEGKQIIKFVTGKTGSGHRTDDDVEGLVEGTDFNIFINIYVIL